MKLKHLFLAAMLYSALYLPAAAHAWQGWRDCPGGYAGTDFKHPEVSPEKQQVYRKIMDEYRDKAFEISNDLRAARTELHYLSRLDKTDPSKIGSLVDKIKSGEAKLYKLRNDTARQLEKQVGLSREHASFSLGCEGGGPCGFRGPDRGPASRPGSHGRGPHGVPGSRDL